MSERDNVDLVKSLVPPVGTDYTDLFRDDAVWAAIKEAAEPFEDIFAVGDDRVVVLGREHGYRVDSGAEVAAESAGVYLVRNGRIVRIDYYAKQAEALEAVGLA